MPLFENRETGPNKRTQRTVFSQMDTKPICE